MNNNFCPTCGSQVVAGQGCPNCMGQQMNNMMNNSQNGMFMDNNQSMNMNGQPMNMNSQSMNMNSQPMNMNRQSMNMNNQSMNMGNPQMNGFDPNMQIVTPMNNGPIAYDPNWKNTKAVWALVCGVVAFFLVGFFAFLGLALGISALNDSKTHNGKGRGLAIASIVINIICVVLIVLNIVLTVAGLM